MKTIRMLRHQTINSLSSQHAEMTADALIASWDQLAVQIILIVGEEGFESLYARSVFLSHSTFPWLAAEALTNPADHRFAQLKFSLQTQTPQLAAEASRLLLVKLTDILASLIGEPLTASILYSAWGGDTQVHSQPGEQN